MILKVIFKVKKVQFGPLLSILANISETVHAVTNVCMKYICKVIYDLSVDLVSFDLGLPLKVKSRSQTTYCILIDFPRKFLFCVYLGVLVEEIFQWKYYKSGGGGGGGGGAVLQSFILCLINGASYDQNLDEIHIASDIYGLSVYLITCITFYL